MLLSDLQGYNIILASESPRRQQLLESAGIPFSVFIDIDVSEEYPVNLKGAEITAFLARKKSEAYPLKISRKDILITADTIVSQGDDVLLKPNDREDAICILKKIANNTHSVFTGVHLRSQDIEASFVSTTIVRFGELSTEEIEYYIDTYKPYDKAGAYGIQEWIGFIGVEEIQGSYFNVMGLPIHMLYREIEKMLKSITHQK